MSDLPGLTKRAAEALKPVMDQLLDEERAGPPFPKGVRLYLAQDEWRELLAAFRESQREAEGVT
jgi:hypothetical protein